MKSKLIKNCIDCSVDISDRHSNTKRCFFCAEAMKVKPKGTMTQDQINEAMSLRGTMPRDEICGKIGVSVANLKRSTPGVSWYYFNRYAANPDLVEEVCRYYEKHGKRKTQEKFPEIGVRCVVERYKNYSPRQSRWTDEQMIELAKMAGLVSMENQAKYFNRPRANRGSITSAWMKNFKCKQAYMHGLPAYKAKLFVKKSCPSIQVDFNPDRYGGTSARVFLWSDAIKHLRKDCPDFVKEGFEAMANFQYKLFGSYPKREINKMIRERANV